MDVTAGRGRCGVGVEAGEVTWVRVRGEMDPVGARTLRRALLEALERPGTREVAVDLRELVFCDSAGLNALLVARLVAVAGGRVLRLVAPGRQVTRLLEITGADSVFTIGDRQVVSQAVSYGPWRAREGVPSGTGRPAGAQVCRRLFGPSW
ncbi:STAS domain-containing protein [Streptomyces roseus]|uniref:STAS domain-containing protein n=1 Tax=Streptomyces roseus TaxID=66430 RepID=UPI003818918F